MGERDIDIFSVVGAVQEVFFSSPEFRVVQPKISRSFAETMSQLSYVRPKTEEEYLQRLSLEAAAVEVLVGAATMRRRDVVEESPRKMQRKETKVDRLSYVPPCCHLISS